MHVQSRTRGSTRLHFQKARWSSEWHRETLDLVWTPGEGFAVAESGGTDDEIAERMLAFVADHGGTGWDPVKQAIKGICDERRRQVRDSLLQAGLLVNCIKVDGMDRLVNKVESRRPSRLYAADDEAINHLAVEEAPRAVQREAGVGEGPGVQLGRGAGAYQAPAPTAPVAHALVDPSTHNSGTNDAAADAHGSEPTSGSEA
jgi:hypothetical protein